MNYFFSVSIEHFLLPTTNDIEPEYFALNGGYEKMLFQGKKFTSSISAHLSLINGINSYSFTLESADEKMIFTKESLWYKKDAYSITSYGPNATVKNNTTGRGAYINRFLKMF